MGFDDDSYTIRELIPATEGWFAVVLAPGEGHVLIPIAAWARADHRYKALTPQSPAVPVDSAEEVIVPLVVADSPLGELWVAAAVYARSLVAIAGPNQLRETDWVERVASHRAALERE